MSQAARIETLDELLRELRLAPAQWDMLLVGDGSGTTWQHACGWGSVLIDRRTLVRKAFHGSWSCGTNNTAEMWAYLHPCLWMLENRKKFIARLQTVQVHIVTDSAHAAQCINQPAVGKQNAVLRDMFQRFRRYGLRLTAHWVRRDRIGLNVFSHHLANAARVTQIPLAEAVQQKRRIADLSHVTPWQDD